MKTSFKKIISAISAAVFFTVLISISLTSAFAQTELAIEVGDASFDTQSTSYVNVPVYITSNASGFIDMQFSVKFDPDVFSSINNVVIPTDSMLYYAPDSRAMDVTEKPVVVAGADNENGLVRVVMSGVFQKNASGISEHYSFTNTGIMFNLRMKLRDDVESISDARSSIEVLVSSDAKTPFIFRSSNGEIPLENVSSKAGTMSIKTAYTVSSLTINTFDLVVQKASEVTPVAFTAAPLCSGIYPQTDIKWYVNDVLCGSGIEFIYTPPASDGTYTVYAQIKDVVSNEIIISVGMLCLPEAPTPQEGKHFIGYNVKLNGNDLLLPAGAQFVGSANELKEAKPVWLTIEMEKGAAVKTSSPAGLRFTAKVNASEYDTLYQAAGRFNFYLGMLIVPVDIVNQLNDFTIESLEEYSSPYAGMLSSGFCDEGSASSSGYYTYTGTIWNILENNYNRQFAARAYATITYSDGTKLIVYSDYNEAYNSRSVSTVAYAAITDTTAEYTAQERTELKRFVDGDVNIAADGTEMFSATEAYEPPYESTLSADQKTVNVTARSGHIWFADEVSAVTYAGERLSKDRYTVKGSKLIISVE